MSDLTLAIPQPVETPLDEVNVVVDLAEAARGYTQQAHLGLEAQNNAAEVRLRVERRAGDGACQPNQGSHPLAFKSEFLNVGIAIKNLTYNAHQFPTFRSQPVEHLISRHWVELVIPEMPVDRDHRMC